MTLRSRTLTLLGVTTLLVGLASPVLAQTGTGTGAPATPPTRDRATPPSRDGRPAGREGRQAPTRGGQAAAPTIKIGQPAPDFTLTGADGKQVSLADHKGKFVVLQWINPDCPFCVRVMEDGVVSTTQAEANKAAGEEVVWLFINSTHYMPPEGTKTYLEKHKSDKPGLVDQAGTVGKLYDAKTTPHVYVIDPEGVLRYHGAINDDASGKNASSDKPVNHYVVSAITQIKAGETVAPDYVKPWGCSVKYPPQADAPAAGRDGAKTPATPGRDPRRDDPNAGRSGRGAPGGLGTGGGGTTR